MTIALTDLDRDELLALCRRRIFFVSAYDLLDAKCDVASARHKAADATLLAAVKRIPAALDVYRTAKGDRARESAWSAYRLLEQAYRKENAKQKRLWRQLEKLKGAA